MNPFEKVVIAAGGHLFKNNEAVNNYLKKNGPYETYLVVVDYKTPVFDETGKLEIRNVGL